MSTLAVGIILVLALIIGGLVMMEKSGRTGSALLSSVVWWLGLLFLLAGVVIALARPLAWLAKQLSEMVGV